MKKNVVRKILIAAVSVLLIALCATVVIFASSAQSETDLGETLQSYQIGLNGKVNLKFTYSSFGDADAFVAEVYTPDGVLHRTVGMYKVDAIQANKTVSVPLAPSEMTYTVKVYPVSLDGEENVIAKGAGTSYSVREYALAVLASDYTSYHNSMRALLNWGAMAQNFFGDATDTLANVDIYKKGTNPINVVDVNSVTFVSHGNVETEGSAFIADNAVSASLLLDRDNIALRFYINTDASLALTSADLTASIYRSGFGSAKAEAVQEKGNGVFFVDINNINVNLFRNVYDLTVEAKDGSVVTAHVSVLEYLDLIIEGKSDTASDEQIAVAKAMYQFYQVSANVGTPETPVTPAENLRAGCWHGSLKEDLATDYHYVASKNTNESYYICSKCFATLGNGVINDGVDLYLPAELLRHSQLLFGSMTLNLIKEEEKTHLSYTNMAVNTGNGQMTYQLVKDSDGISGKYLVFKIRLGTQNATTRPGATSMTTRLFINGSSAALSGATQVDFNVTNDGQWHTVVYELKGAAGFDAETGLGAVKYIEMRPFSVQWYQNAGDTTYYTAPKTDSKMDIQYMSICDGLAELRSVIDTDKYDLYTASNTYETLNTADMLIPEKTVSYSSANKLASLVGEGGDMSKVIMNDGNGDYVRYSDMSFTGTSSYVGYNVVSNAQGVNGRYLVFKIRLGTQNATTRPGASATSMTTNIFVNTNTNGLTGCKQINFAVNKDDQWHTVVYDLSKLGDANYNAETGIGNIKRIQIRPFCVQWSVKNEDGTYSVAPTTDSTMDLAYVAVCDDIDDIKYIIDTDTYDFYTDGSTKTTYNTADNTTVAP